MANSEWRVGMRIERASDQVLPGPARLAGRHDVGRDLLAPDPGLSAGRTVRDVVTDQKVGFVYSGQYRGTSWAREYAVVHPISADCARFAERTGNTSAALGEGWLARQKTSRDSDGTVRRARKDAPVAHSFAATEGSETLMSPSIAIRYSPFAIRYSP